MTTSTTSNHLHTTSTEAVKSDHLHHLHHLPRGRWWCGGGQEGEDGGTTSTSMNLMSQPAPAHGEYHEPMTIVAGIAAIAAATLALTAPVIVLAAAQGRRQADRTAAAELERRRGERQ